MGREARCTKIRRVANYHPGHPGSETIYSFIPHVRKLIIGKKEITRNTTTHKCEGRRALYQKMKQVDKARNQ